MFQMKLNFFTADESFPFFIQYGFHTENMYLHSHEHFYELVIVLAGSAVHIVNDEAFYIAKGDVFIIGADTFHGYQETKNFRICNLMFKPDFFFNSTCDLKKTPGFQGLFVIEPFLSQNGGFQSRLKLDPYHYEKVYQMIAQMIKEYENPSIGYKTLLTGYFYTLSVMLSRLYSQSANQIEPDMIGMAKSIAYIENYYMEDLTLTKLAKIAGFSPRHFSRKFYELKQTTPGHYIQTLRLEQSAYYLRHTHHSITAIAAQCGFPDSNYFSRLFKKHYGLSPTAFQKNTVL